MASEVLHLEPLEHRGRYCIAIRGRLSAPAESIIRAFQNRLYSKTHACWYLVYSREVLSSIREKLQAFQPVELGQFDEPVNASVKIIGFQLPPGYHEKLIEVRYSPATVKTYESQMREFLSYLHPKTLNDLTDGIIKGYMRHLAEKKKVSASTQNTAINSIKFYLEKVLGGDRKVYYVDRPLKDKRLPRVLSEREVTAMIDVTQNPKHRLMIMLLFSAGLRLSELLNLMWSDFDVDRLKIFVNGGKGRKDRYTVLSEKIIPFIMHYLGLYHPAEYLFEGLGGGKYSARSVGRVIQRAAFLAGINKRVSPHTLRHSFATNMLEHGVDLRYIQMLLGHESSITTERYTHMTTKGFSAIKSPLDWLRIEAKPLNLLND